MSTSELKIMKVARPKSIGLGTIALAAILSVVGHAQAQTQAASQPAIASVKSDPKDLSGTWQGTLQAGGTLRIVVKMVKADDGWETSMYSIDEGLGARGVGKATLQGTNVHYRIVANGGTYDAKLSADGSGMSGHWIMPGKDPLDMKLVRIDDAASWAIPMPPDPPKAMAADADPAFDVLTIKPSTPGAQGSGFGLQGRNVLSRNTSLLDMIAFAYGLHVKQVVDGPAWIDKDRYDLSGTADKDGAPSTDQRRLMFKKMLAERFHLTVHPDKRELSVYVLTVAKGTPKNFEKSTQKDDKVSFLLRPTPGGMTLIVANGTVKDFTGPQLMGFALDRPVLNQTNITGRYNFQVSWTPGPSEFGGRLPPLPPSDNVLPALSTALNEQLGLKFESTKTAADVVVVDKAEKPTEN